MRVSLESMVDEIQGSNTSKCSYFEAFCKQAMKCVCVCGLYTCMYVVNFLKELVHLE